MDREAALAAGAVLGLLGLAVATAGGGERTITTVAGTGREALDAMEGRAIEVSIGQPFGVEIGPGGKLYICEIGNHRILALDREAGTIRTVAGTGRKGGGGDGGPATAANLNEPY
jgi:streptogramin lyase